MPLPLEDTFADLIGKAQKGLHLSDSTLAERAAIPLETLAQLQEGVLHEAPLRQLAPALGLHPDSLLDIAHRAWAPPPLELEGLLAFSTYYEAHDMAVNHYIAFDPHTKAAAIFDTGMDPAPTLAALAAHGLDVQAIFITHTHFDHIAALPALRQAFPQAPVYCGRGEALPLASPIDHGFTYPLGNLALEARETSGHATCGMSYLITGLAQPLAIVGDALFAGSMGGPRTSWSQALDHNRQHLFSLPPHTLIAPGHGPLTTIAEEKAHNPFYPEFKSPTP